LLLTDDLMLSSQVERLLGTRGCQLQVARDAENLCQQAAEADVRWLILDLTYGGIDPQALATRLRASGIPATKWIAVGPHVHLALLEAARSAGWRVLTRGQLHAGQWARAES
jgi:CheY-like chemotaxis protein